MQTKSDLYAGGVSNTAKRTTLAQAGHLIVAGRKKAFASFNITATVQFELNVAKVASVKWNTAKMVVVGRCRDGAYSLLSIIH